MRARCLALLLAAGAPATLACAIGPEQEPGCHVDAECGDGGACRAGACFHTTTGQTPPSVADAGDTAID
jgi:hypothetical protein